MEAERLLEDGERLFGAFEVVATPGHTPGHVSYFYHPERALFAGDALAVVAGRVRLMARAVTRDVTGAGSSVERCLSLRPAILCPGHREPLVQGVEGACEVMRRTLASGAPWPLFG